MNNIPYSKKVGQANIISILAIILIISSSLIYLFSQAIVSLEKENSEQTQQDILQAKKEYIQEVVNMMIQLIDNERFTCEQQEKGWSQENVKTNLSDGKACSEKSIQERMKTFIRNTRLKDNGYIWINYVLNFDGGDKYAIRLVHPNLIETEGMYLSTELKDIKGNTPYLTELEGVKESGEIFFDYWFKKMNSDLISHKLTFAKLYHDYNWIIATGVYLDDIDELVALEAKNTHELLLSVIIKPIIMLFAAILISLLIALFFHRKILKTITIYSDRTAEKEKALETLNKELEEKVKQGTEEVLEKAVKLEESEKRFELCVNGSQDGIWDWEDINSEKYWWSPRLYEMLDYQPGDFVPTISLWKELMHPDDHEKIISVLKDHFSKKLPYEVEFRMKKKDGDYMWMYARGESIRDKDGKPIRMAGSVTDITERKEAEEALAKSERNFQAMFNSIPTGLVFADRGRKIQMVNPGFTRIWGYDLEEVIGRDTEFLYASRKDYLEAGRKRYHVDGASDATPFEIKYKRKDGTLFFAETIGCQVINDKGEVVGYFAVHQDITDRKRAEQEHDELQSKLRQSTKMQAVGTLAGGIAHEFNNLLAVILGFTDLAILETPQYSEAKDLLESVKKASIRASDLVKQILAFSRQSQQKKLPLNLGVLIKESLQLINQSIPSSVEIKKNIDTQGVTSTVDPTEIQQITMNLCSNAVWAMKEQGTINISLLGIDLNAKKAKSLGVPKGKYAELTFSDNGQGIDEETKTRIFEPFFTQKEVGEGTGMGLSIVYSIIESYGGVITVESEPGKGTTFQLYFPVTTKPAVEKPEDLEELPKGTEHILLVDDEKMVAEMEYKIITSLGYDVDLHLDSQKALNAFKKSPDSYQLIITDQVMPEISGEDLAKEIRSIKPQMPIILCTGHSSQINDEKAKAIGINAFVYKPLLINDFAKLIRKVLDDK